MSFGTKGSTRIVEIARFGMKSSTGDHDAPLVVVFQSPPETLPAKIVRPPRPPGLIANDRTRPPILPGPSQVHVEREMPAIDSRASTFWVAPASHISCTWALAFI